MTALKKLNNTQTGDKTMEKIKALLMKLFGFVDANKDGKIDIAEVTAAVDKAEVEVKKAKAKVKKVIKK